MSFLAALPNFLLGQQARSRSLPPPTESVDGLIERLKAQAAPCTRLAHGGNGRSRLGGTPDLERAWSRFQGRPLTFLAQLDLADVRTAGAPAWLPDRGLLLFFYDFEHGAWGLDPHDAGSFSVVHVIGAASVDIPQDLSADDLFPERPPSFSADLSHPEIERLGDDWKQLSDSEYQALEAAIEGLSPPKPAHQISGYPGPSKLMTWNWNANS